MDTLSRAWKLIAFRGLLAIAFGIFAFSMPSLTLAVLMMIFGLYALADGLVTVIAGSRAGVRHGFLLALEGVAGIALGVCALFFTAMTTLVLVEILGLWAIVTGGLEIAAAIRLRDDAGSATFLLFAAAASLVVGAAMLAFPTYAALAIVFLLAVYALAFGTAMLAFALRMRSAARHAREALA